MRSPLVALASACALVALAGDTRTDAQQSRAPRGTTSQYRPLDFDGDAKTDMVVIRNVGGDMTWYVRQSVDGEVIGRTWGFFSDVPVPGDYDGDGYWDFAVWRPTNGVFYICRSSDGAVQIVQFGQNGDDPRMVQDYDGDGRTDLVVTRRDAIAGVNTFYILGSAAGFSARVFGLSSMSDLPIRGDFDGDEKADLAVYRPEFSSPPNTFFVLRSTDGGLQARQFGSSSIDHVVQADFDGDFKTDYAVYRDNGPGQPAAWYWLESSTGTARGVEFGVSFLDLPTPGDFDGDNRTDVTVWRNVTPAFYYSLRTMLGFDATQFGQINDVPVAFPLLTRQ
jgi:hypothetical protein